MSEADGKTDRLAAALRANLARRKAQARARRVSEVPPSSTEQATPAEADSSSQSAGQERIVSRDEAG